MKFLYENENIPSDLIPHIRDNISLHPYFEYGFKGIKPKNYCGFLSVEGESYFIVPKIVDEESANTDIFIYMLLYAYGVNLKNEALMQGAMQEQQILELFIRLFADELLKEFKRGVLRQYITIQENLKVLRGKYLIECNFQNFYHQNLYCEFDEFSMDNPLNQFFLYAIKIFRRYSRYPNLHRCEAILDEITSVHIDLNRLKIHFDRMNSRYQKSYEVAMIILQHLVSMTQKSSDRSFAFLFDMAEVFEKFVGRMMQQIDPTTRLQVQRNFGNLQLKPDIVTERMIIDTKYKSIGSKDDLATHDKYQVFAYGVNFQKYDTMLLYPKHKVDVCEDLVLGNDENRVNLRMRSLDLGFDGGYNEYLNIMKKRVENTIYGS